MLTVLQINAIVSSEDFLKIIIAFIAGASLGIEREYRNKPAGFRTLIMITVGACMFTILSARMDIAAPGRIAANIITGVGFIGAGVIFKEGMKMSGMTTAATIWICAAIGMAVGYGFYALAIAVTLLMLFILVLLGSIEHHFSKFHQVRNYKISFTAGECSFDILQKKLRQFGIRFKKDTEMKHGEEIIVFYKLTATQKEFDEWNNYLMQTRAVTAFEI